MRLCKLFIPAATLVALCFSCNRSKTQDDAWGNLPLITTSEELSAASTKAGSRMVVLDLYADWCGPCRILSPTLDDLSKEYKGKADFYRINVDNSSGLSRSFGVKGIPYVVFMKSGKAVYALTGLHPKEDYEKVLGICNGAATADECVKNLNEKL
jgi:thioredoxin 1